MRGETSGRIHIRFSAAGQQNKIRLQKICIYWDFFAQTWCRKPDPCEHALKGHPPCCCHHDPQVEGPNGKDLHLLSGAGFATQGRRACSPTPPMLFSFLWYIHT